MSTQDIIDQAAANVANRRQYVDAFVDDLVRTKRLDATLAPAFAHQLIHTFEEVQETSYPELAAAEGKVLPIDNSVDPADNTWEDYRIDTFGSADWVGDDGEVDANSAVVMTRYTGSMAEMAHPWTETIFDLERAAKTKIPLTSLRGKIAVRAHAAKTNYAWLCGDAAKNIVGLLNHPNIPATMAALNAGASSRLWINKTNDEILADLAALIDAIPANTFERHYAAVVKMPASLLRLLKNRTVSNGGLDRTLWGLVKELYSGDDTGQGKVSFEVLNETQADRRSSPKSGVDESGILGDILFAMPAPNPDIGHFLRARPFTQRPPQEIDLKVHVMTHSKIGGARIREPLAFHRLEFGLT